MGEPYVFVNPWQIHELEGISTDQMRFCTISEIPMDDVDITNTAPSNEQYRAILEIGKISGYYHQIRWLYNSMQANFLLFKSRYNLKLDDLIDMPGDMVDSYGHLVAADAAFRSVIISAKNFIDSAERCIKKNCSVNSEHYVAWKKISQIAYDQSLVYALMYDLRNNIEHDFWTLSLVNYDVIHQKAGLVLNIDNDLLNLKSLKKGLRERLIEWGRERHEDNKSAWLSVGKCLESYQDMIQVMYCTWLLSCISQTALCIEEYEGVLNSIPNNAILWHGEGVSMYSTTGQPRIYRIFNHDFSDYLKKEEKEIRKSLNVLYDVKSK